MLLPAPGNDRSQRGEGIAHGSVVWIAGGARSAQRRSRAGQGQRHPELHAGRDPGVAQPAGDRRFLGALVRPLQAARADHRAGGQERRRQGPPGQDQHRREPRARPAAAHPVDPDGLRLQPGPAGRRLRWRAAREPDQGVRRAPHGALGAGPGGGRDRAGEGARGRRPARPGGPGLRADPATPSPPIPRRWPGSPAPRSASAGWRAPASCSSRCRRSTRTTSRSTARARR